MRYARIVVVEGVQTAAEIFIPPAEVTIDQCFHPMVVAQFVECPAEVEVGWTLADDLWSPPEEPVP